MNHLKHKIRNRIQRQHRVRARITGSAERPRLSVHVSNLNVTAQIIDDQQMKTLVYATSVGNKNLSKRNMTEKAREVGNEIAVKAKKVGINSVVFDRGSKLFHGRIKALADAARDKGLEF